MNQLKLEVDGCSSRTVDNSPIRFLPEGRARCESESVDDHEPFQLARSVIILARIFELGRESMRGIIFLSAPFTGLIYFRVREREGLRT